MRAHGPARLPGVTADTALLQRWQSASANWLATAPATAAETRLLLEAFDLYLDRCDGTARLILIGEGAVTAADDTLQAAIADSGCAAHIERLVDADDACTKAALLSADALLLLRANLALMHEAMVLGTPIIGAGAHTGVIEAGLLWEDADAGLLAASVERLRRDAVLRTRLRECGFAQLMCSPAYAGSAANQGASA